EAPSLAAEAKPPATATPAASGAESEGSSKDDLRRTRSSPLVRKIAEEHGIDISQIEGTGISGRVTKQDILSFIENRGAAANPHPAAPAPSAQAPAPAQAAAAPAAPARATHAARAAGGARA